MEIASELLSAEERTIRVSVPSFTVAMSVPTS